VPRLRQVPRAEASEPIVTTMYDYLFELPFGVSGPSLSFGQVLSL
jgi:hypothetical protein